MSQSAKHLNTGPDLLNAVRAGFIARGTTLTAWCDKQEPRLAVQNARMALLGGWRGPVAQKLVKRIIKAAWLNPHKEGLLDVSVLEPVKELKADLRRLNTYIKKAKRRAV